MKNYKQFSEMLEKFKIFDENVSIWKFFLNEKYNYW